MKCIIAVFLVCLAATSCLAQTPGSPVAMPKSPMTKPAPVIPDRMKGCRPGCGATDICVELADNYCRPTQRCSVCAKMSSIRFPTAALSGILKAPGVAPGAPSVPQMQQTQQYYPQQQGYQNYNRQGQNMLLPAMLFGGFDMGLF